MSLLYFDHAASAPRRDEVFEAMAPFLRGVVGNPSGTHRAARAARRAIEDARETVADFGGVEPGGVVFTAGGTESCHLAITGVVSRVARLATQTEVVVSSVEHHAVLESAHDLERHVPGVCVRHLGVDSDGVIDLESLSEIVNAHTAVVSVMCANNETGVIQPVNDVATYVRTHAPQALSHTDAVAAAPWMDLAVATSNVDLISICAHKLGGPVNAGALLMRSPVALDAVVSGGGQERGRRGGTVDVAAAVGLAAAITATKREREQASKCTRVRRDYLARCLLQVEGVEITAASAERLPGHVHLTVDGVASDEMLFLLDQRHVCASAASSCSSGAVVASHVLAAMNMAPERARGAMRFTMGAETTDIEIDHLVQIFNDVVHQLRSER